MPSDSATTAAAPRQAASASRSIAAQSAGGPAPMARGSSGQGSRISKTKGRPRSRCASSAGSATVSGVELAMHRSYRPESASGAARAAKRRKAAARPFRPMALA
jgi:hypothetical protein